MNLGSCEKVRVFRLPRLGSCQVLWRPCELNALSGDWNLAGGDISANRAVASTEPACPMPGMSGSWQLGAFEGSIVHP